MFASIRRSAMTPVPERRRRRRVITLRNFGMAAIAGVVFFIAISIQSEVRDRVGASYGRLFGKTIDPVAQKPLDVVHEAPAPVADDTNADPTLIAPMVRSQWLTSDPNAPETSNISEATAVAATYVTPRMQSADSHLVVVGGPEGVAIVQKERTKPVLTGGFGRQQ